MSHLIDPTPMHLHDADETAHLKAVPDDAARQYIRQRAALAAARWPRGPALLRSELEARGRAFLAEEKLPEAHLGWSLVELATAFWRDEVAAVPQQRRLLLLPHCVRRAETCPAAYNPLGLACQDCGACDLAELRSIGERLGYRVLIAEGSPAVMQLILAGEVDAIVGVACLDALEKTLDKVLLAGIPCLASPLLGNGCRNTTADVEWVRQMIRTPHQPDTARGQTYIHLLRTAAGLFAPERLGVLVGRSIGPTLDAAAATDDTAAVALDFVAAGGKYSRPFVTLAAYDARSGGRGTTADGPATLAALPAAVLRVALAIELFHKASLVHDDIEDEDLFRYGRPAVHRRCGQAIAINVGDYLVGLGYRMVGGQRDVLGDAAVAEIITQLADAHTRLCEGQGRELAWRRAARVPAPADVLAMYALKTAPAFEAALLAGLRMAGPIGPLGESLARFSRHLGVAYQILNDLEDWTANRGNKRQSGRDVLCGRPTILASLALDRLPSGDAAALRRLLAAAADDRQRLNEVDLLFRKAAVRSLAARLVAKHRERALSIAAAVDEPLRRLLQFLVDAILK